MNNYVNNQAQFLTDTIQNYQEQVIGEPIRVYPFKIVSGLSYMSNRGMTELGTNIGSTIPISNQTLLTNAPYGSYSDMSLLYAGNKPIIAYWFGTTTSSIATNGSITTTINAKQDANGNWIPQKFKNPFTATISGNDVNGNPIYEEDTTYPWKECGVVNFSFNSQQGKNQTLDNVETATYQTIYNYSLISNTWLPSFQEVNEFVYFIVDSRYACPIALRISAVVPHTTPDGLFQWSEIELESVNQYFNTSDRSILTYIKFGAVNDGYCFPEEVIENGQRITRLNMNLLNPQYGGVSSVCIKNNSMVAQMGTLIYGHPYVSFVANENGVLSKTTQPDRYLIPYQFEPPIADSIVSRQSFVQSSYSLAMNMCVISEQLWGSWKQTKEIYNPIQNFTFQGGLTFAVKDVLNKTSNQVLYDSINQILNPGTNASNYRSIITQNFPGKEGIWGSGNLENIILSNAYNYPLDILQKQTWEDAQENSIKGFALPLTPSGASYSSWDFRNLFLTWGFIKNGVSQIADLFNAGYQPSTQTTSELGYLNALANGNMNAQNLYSISPVVAYILMSMSMRKTHTLEINYRDGIVYTNTNRGHGGFLNMIANWMSGIADKITGYTPGTAEFFMNTTARTYNLFVPSSLVPLFQTYLNPSGNNYNAIPLDIFDNSYDNNTAVGQLKYMSGLQFSLTDKYNSKQPDKQGNFQLDTLGWTGNYNPSTTTLKAEQQLYYNNKDGETLYVPNNSFAYFESPAEPIERYVIDEINVKQLGQSNLHLTYLTNVNDKLLSSGEEWIVNNAKVMKNNSFIDNDFDYYAYDEYNLSVQDNSQPFFNLQYAPISPSVPTFSTEFPLNPNANVGFFGLKSTSTFKGVVINNQQGTALPNPVALSSFPSDAISPTSTNMFGRGNQGNTFFPIKTYNLNYGAFSFPTWSELNKEGIIGSPYASNQPQIQWASGYQGSVNINDRIFYKFDNSNFVNYIANNTSFTKMNNGFLPATEYVESATLGAMTGNYTLMNAIGANNGSTTTTEYNYNITNLYISTLLFNPNQVIKNFWSDASYKQPVKYNYVIVLMEQGSESAIQSYLEQNYNTLWDNNIGSGVVLVMDANYNYCYVSLNNTNYGNSTLYNNPNKIECFVWGGNNQWELNKQQAYSLAGYYVGNGIKSTTYYQPAITGNSVAGMQLGQWTSGSANPASGGTAYYVGAVPNYSNNQQGTTIPFNYTNKTFIPYCMVMRKD